MKRPNDRYGLNPNRSLGLACIFDFLEGLILKPKDCKQL